MPLILLALFIVIPLAELYVIIKVGEAIGILPTLAILIADSILGTVLLRSQGRTAWRRFQLALQQSRVPHREVFDGAMVILGGALLLTPGFITDIVGIILLLPPTRAVVWQMAKRFVVGRVAFGPRVASWGYGRARDRRRGYPASEGEPGGPSPGGPPPRWPPGAGPPPGVPGWQGPPTPPESAGPRPGDLKGTAHEVGETNGRLPEGEPGRGERSREE